MNADHVKGTIKNVKGKVKEEVGHLAGSERTTGEGILDQVSGKIQKGFGDLKDAVKEKVDNLLHTEKSPSNKKAI